MSVFQTLVHPTDFDEPSKEAFRRPLKGDCECVRRLVESEQPRLHRRDIP